MQICDGLTHAHQRGVIHRDVKPGNVLVEIQDNGDPQVKVLDFGLARLTSSDTTCQSVITEQGRLLGTIGYMSPEQIAGNINAIDIRTDIYGVGAIGYTLLAGAPPIDVGTGSMYARLHAAMENSPRPLSHAAPVVAPDLAAIIDKSIARKKDDRYESTRAMCMDLARFQADEPVLARRIGKTERLWRFAKRRKRAATAIIVIVLALVTAFAGLAFGLVRARDAARQSTMRFDQASATAEFLVDQVFEQLQSLAGSNKVRRIALERIVPQLRDLLEEKSNNKTLWSRYGAALELLSDLEYEERRFAKSLDLRRQSLPARIKAFTLDTSDADALADVSIIIVKIGDVVHANGDANEFLNLYRVAYVVDLGLSLAHPDNRRFLDNLSWSYDRLAKVLIDRGRYREARPFLLARLDLAGRLSRLAPDDAQTHITTAFTSLMMYDVLSRTGAPRLAHQSAWRAVAGVDEALRTSPDNRDYRAASIEARIDVATALCAVLRYGVTLTVEEQNHLDQALRESLNLSRALLSDDPTSWVAIARRASALNASSLYAQVTGDTETALMRAEDELRVIDAALQENAVLGEVQFQYLASCLLSIATISYDLGRVSYAESIRQRLIDLCDAHLARYDAVGQQARSTIASALLLSPQASDAEMRRGLDALADVSDAAVDAVGLHSLRASLLERLGRYAEATAELRHTRDDLRENSWVERMVIDDFNRRIVSAKAETAVAPPIPPVHSVNPPFH